MSSVQERLQIKRIPLDNWSIREQLCLASAVVRSGDQNWMSVSRSLKSMGDANRPADWYSQKSCAAQYGVLLENVETPKRKKRSSESAVETPQESILKKLTQERIVEIQKTLAEMNQQYDQMKNDLVEIRNPSTSEDRLKEMWAAVEAAKRAREREIAKRTAWLKEREDRRARAEKTWRPPSSTTVGATPGTDTPTTCSPPPAPPAPSSPLLTSLLKSSPVVTTPQHMSHPANVVDSISPSAGAPTLSMLLEQSGNRTADNKHAAIEHIKSQLVQIEKRLKARTTSTTAPLDIDDIEIKAEDVYAFRDVDIHIPPVGLHKGAVRPSDKPDENKDGVESTSAVVQATSDENIDENEVKEEPIATETIQEEITEVEAITEETIIQEQPPEPETRPQEPAVKISFPEVKFPTPEIKVIQPEIQKVKEEVKEPEVVSPPEESEVNALPQEVVVEDVPMEVEASVPPEPALQPIEEKPEELPVVQPEPNLVEIRPEDIPLPPETSVQAEEVVEPQEPPPLPPTEPEPEAVAPDEPKKVQSETPVKPEAVPETKEPEVELKPPVVEEIKRDEDAEDSIPLKEIVEETKAKQAEAKPEKKDEETHTETDDDAPMELSREEEKDGKKKRDYSRKKKSDSRTCSGSESAAEQSAPESPATDSEKLHRLWKKSVMLVYSRLCAHKYASLFARPITDEEAPGYSRVVRRPMDLSTIRKHIDNGTLRTTADFHRDILLMLTNALMYNNTQHSVYGMAKEMFEEAKNQLGMLLAAQAHAGLCQPTRLETTRKRTRNEMSR